MTTEQKSRSRKPFSRTVLDYPSADQCSEKLSPQQSQPTRTKVAKSGLKRLLYWATFLAQFIITSVSLTFLYFNTYFWPIVNGRSLDFGGAIHLLCFAASSILTQYNFLMAIFVGPGYVPDNWKPPSDEDSCKLQYCHVCEGFKAPRSHHCRQCGLCVLKMEHHCPWINNCVGHRNHAYFLRFLFFAVIGCTQATVLFVLMFFRFFNMIYSGAQSRYPRSFRSSFNSDSPSLSGKWVAFLNSFNLPPVMFSLPGILWLVITTGFAVGVVIAVGALFVIQLRIIWRNETSVERWIINKANYYRTEEALEKDPKHRPVTIFENPYHMGWRHNLQQIILNKSGNPIGDGIWWPVRESCDQFTLTLEQLRQKQFKRDFSMTFAIQKPYNGRIFPLFSQGFIVCLSFPWTVDEPRLILQPGDLVRVTRYQKRWLYGIKIKSRPTNGTSTSVGSSVLPEYNLLEEKGWFPRQIAEKARV